MNKTKYKKDTIKQRDIAELINNNVESLEDELIRFTQKIIKIPTENPPGQNYPECAKAIGEKMREIGCSVEYVEVPESLLPKLAPNGEGLPRVSVIGRYKGEKFRPLLHFSGHFDVVPAGSDWTLDPYEGIVKNGNIYGRGTSDQKSGIAAQIFAIYALKKAGLQLEGTILSSATPDEETGGNAGLGYLVNQGYISDKNTDYCVITECLDVDKICLGHRGTFWFEIETKGIQSHGSMPFEGVNAIDKMIKLINEIKYQTKTKLKKQSKYLIMPFECRKSTLTVTMINAGTKVNVVPNSCKAEFDWRLIPEHSVLEAEKTIISICEGLKKSDPEFNCKINIIQEIEPILVPRNTTVVKAFQESVEFFLRKPVSFSISPGSDDQRFVVKNGNIQQCIVYGPGSLVMAHKSDEYVPIEDLKNAVKVMALAAIKLLGIKK